MDAENPRAVPRLLSAPPEPAPDRWHRLFVVPPGPAVVVIALGEQTAWLWRHYTPGGRLVWCPGPCECSGTGQHATEPVQSGYLAVLTADGQQLTAVISAECYRRGDGLRAADGRLRGRKLRLSRAGTEANSPLNCAVGPFVDDVDALPPEWPLGPELARRYGVRYPARSLPPGKEGARGE